MLPGSLLFCLMPLLLAPPISLLTPGYNFTFPILIFIAHLKITSYHSNISAISWRYLGV